MLRFVKAVDFIDEKDRLLAKGTVSFGFLHDGYRLVGIVQIAHGLDGTRCQLHLDVCLRGGQGFRKEIVEDALRAFFAPRGERIGAPADRDALSAVLQKLPGVLLVDSVELRGLDQNSYQTTAGDLTVMPDTILHLTGTAVSLSKDRR